MHIKVNELFSFFCVVETRKCRSKSTSIVKKWIMIITVSIHCTALVCQSPTKCLPFIIAQAFWGYYALLKVEKTSFVRVMCPDYTGSSNWHNQKSNSGPWIPRPYQLFSRIILNRANIFTYNLHWMYHFSYKNTLKYLMCLVIKILFLHTFLLNKIYSKCIDLERSSWLVKAVLQLQVVSISPLVYNE